MSSSTDSYITSDGRCKKKGGGEDTSFRVWGTTDEKGQKHPVKKGRGKGWARRNPKKPVTFGCWSIAL